MEKARQDTRDSPLKVAACGLVWLFWPIIDGHRWCGAGQRCDACRTRTEGDSRWALDEEPRLKGN